MLERYTHIRMASKRSATRRAVERGGQEAYYRGFEEILGSEEGGG
jgi:hypothetical protein